MSALSFYWKLEGRISRKALWLAYILPFMALGVIANFSNDFTGFGPRVEVFGEKMGLSALAFTVLTLWPEVATSVRRFHDLNVTGWWVLSFVPLTLWYPDTASFISSSLILLVPTVLVLIVGGLLTLAQLFVPGTVGANKYGSDPLGTN